MRAYLSFCMFDRKYFSAVKYNIIEGIDEVFHAFPNVNKDC